MAHMPTLAIYTAAVGALWYTMLAVRLAIQSYKDTRDWYKSWRAKR